MDLTINLKVNKRPLSIEAENIKLYAAGQSLNLEVSFTNAGNSPLKLIDPLSYAETVLIYRDSESVEDSIFYLNPGNVDATGEMTAPVETEIELLPNALVSRSIDLSEYIPEPPSNSPFEVEIMYGEQHSNTLKIKMLLIIE